MMTKDTAAIQNRALLVTLSVSIWTARRYDGKVTSKVNTEHGATHDAGRYNKHLLGGPGTILGDIASAAQHARNLHLQNGLPWKDDGTRLLPVTNFFEYTDVLRKARTTFEQAVKAFVDAYPDLVEQAKAKLGTMFDATDYPAPDEIATRFKFSTDFLPVPSAGDFKLSLPADQVAELEQSITDQVQRRIEAAHRDLWQRLRDVVKDLHDKVTDPQIDAQTKAGAAKRAAIQDQLIQKGFATVQQLDRLNVVSDTDFADIQRDVLAVVESADAGLLRKSAAERAKVANETASILNAMSMFYNPNQPTT